MNKQLAKYIPFVGYDLITFMTEDLVEKLILQYGGKTTAVGEIGWEVAPPAISRLLPHYS